MNMETTIHRVVSITNSIDQYGPKCDGDYHHGTPFNVRKLIVTDEQGHKDEIKLSADDIAALEIKDAA
mgnify:CR=1 FL=1